MSICIQNFIHLTLKTNMIINFPNMILQSLVVVWWMTIKKAAKTTFFCEGVHTGRNLWICMRDGIKRV